MRELTRSKILVSVAASTLALAFAREAQAQEVPPQPQPAGIQAANTAAAASPGGTDHERHVNQIGLRYFGAVTGPAGMGTPAPTVHNVGIRYWLSSRLGIEGGLGLSLVAAGAVQFGVGLYGAVPINLAATQHLAIHIIPNLTFAIPNVDPFGLVVVAGADAAAELSFGFIGVPQMSLQARMGLNLGITVAGGGNSVFALGTTAGSGANVWDVIAGSVSATYYFGR